MRDKKLFTLNNTIFSVFLDDDGEIQVAVGNRVITNIDRMALFQFHLTEDNLQALINAYKDEMLRKNI